MLRNFFIVGLFSFVMVSMAIAQGVGPERNRGSNDKVMLKGEIDTINNTAKQIVVENVTVQVTPSTMILQGGLPLEFKDLEVGDTVCILGKYKKKILIAFIIVVKECGGGCGEVQGDIDSIDSVNKLIVVDDVKVKVTPNTIIKKKCEQIKFEDLEVGMFVCVQGEYKGKILYATQITVKGGCGGGGGC